MRLRNLFLMHKSDQRILLTLLLVATLIVCGMVVIDGNSDELMAGDEQLADSAAVRNEANRPTRNSESEVSNRSHKYYGDYVMKKSERFFFDPNTADSSQLLRLGLQPWQVRNIYKYRAAGGIYRQKEDFALLYGLTQKEYRELEPYIRISSDYQPAALLVKRGKDRHAGGESEGGMPAEDGKKSAGRDSLSYKLTEGMTVSLSTADSAQLRRVPGIGYYFARRILAYRERLGGYVSIDQLDEIEDFPAEAKHFFTVDTNAAVRKLNLNTLSLNELKRHPYINYYQARAIVDYRRVKGKLTSLDDLQLLRDFSAEARQRLAPYVKF